MSGLQQSLNNDKMKIPRFRGVRFFGAIIVITLLLILYGFLSDSSQRLYKHVFPDWKINFEANGSNRNIFIHSKSENEETFFISALTHIRKNKGNTADIFLTGFDSSGGDANLMCCVLCSDDSLLTVKAKFHNIHGHMGVIPTLFLQIFNPAYFYAIQYKCQVPEPRGGVQIKNISVSLSSVCSHESKDYLPVRATPEKEDGLAICAKVAFGFELKPSRLVEWFEMQKILGVDKILLFDLDCPENIKAVFKHYVEEGLLEVQPYSLPGTIKGYESYERGLHSSNRIKPQDSHDEMMTVLDCHQRLNGYKYILASDFDEFIIPKKHDNLKQLLKYLTSQNPNSVGFYFYVQFYLYEWKRKRTDTDIHIQQYLMSTKPRWECQKYIYQPSKAYSANAHSFYTNHYFAKTYVDPELATIHHYRKCPRGWKTCFPEIIFDNTIVKYEKNHTRNVLAVLKKEGIKPYDSVQRAKY